LQIAPQVVPDDAACNGFAKSDLRPLARFFESPAQRIKDLI
jgi:hypothetical protein